MVDGVGIRYYVLYQETTNEQDGPSHYITRMIHAYRHYTGIIPSYATLYISEVILYNCALLVIICQVNIC